MVGLPGLVSYGPSPPPSRAPYHPLRPAAGPGEAILAAAIEQTDFLA